MCDIVPATSHISEHWDTRGLFKRGETELVFKVDEEDNIIVNEKFISQLHGEIFCKHPDTDWHKMEVKPGESLHCPADTTLKLVLPEPYLP